MSEFDNVTIYGVKINSNGDVISQWERQGSPIQLRGMHLGYRGDIAEYGAFAESERSFIHAIDVAKMVMRELGGGSE